MPYLNRITIIGHVGKNAEVRTTHGGDRVLSFSVATTEKWKDKGGSPKERTTWHRVARWGAPNWMAEAITTGSLVYVDGALIHNAYEVDGQKRDSWEIRAQTVLPLVTKGPGVERSATPTVDDVPF